MVVKVDFETPKLQLIKVGLRDSYTFQSGVLALKMSGTLLASHSIW
jgi:hypothetical protein